MNSELMLRRVYGAGRADDPALNLTVRDVISFYRRRWKGICLTAIASVIVASLVATKLTPLYTSTAQVIVERPSASPIVEYVPPPGIASYDSSFIDSQVSILRSTQLLTRVVEHAGLLEDPEFVGDEAPSLVSRVRDLFSNAFVALDLFGPQPDEQTAAPGDLTSRANAASPEVSELFDEEPQSRANTVRDLLSDFLIALGLSGPEPDAQTTAPVDLTSRAVERLRKAMSVNREGRSYVIAISITSDDPNKAATLVNTVAEAYISDHIEARYEQAKQASSWLTERMAALQAQLKSAEDAVEEFKSKHNLLVTKAGTLTEQQLSELNIQLITTRAELAQKRAAFEHVRNLVRTGGDTQSIPQVLASDVIIGLRAQHSDVIRREADLRSRFGERHPQVINIRAERLAAERQIAAEVERIIANLANEVQMAETREASLALSLGRATGQMSVDNQVGIQLRELERVANANQTLYEGFLARARVMEEETSFRSSGIRVISRGSAPEDPSFPPTKVIVLFGLMMGAGLGTFGALAREFLHAGFVTAGQAEKNLDLPILASVPQVFGSRLPIRRAHRGPLPLLLQNPQSSYSEAVRTLRHALIMDGEAAQTPIVQIISSINGEGKTTLAMSLAASATAAGYRVLIVDADLRRSGLTRHFGMLGAPGLVDVITGKCSIGQNIRLDERTSAHLLPAGSRASNPSDLLGSARMRLFLDEVRKAFDIVILDGPPVGAMADARILSRHADAVAFIVKWSSTPREVVIRAMHGLDRTKIKGLAINMVDERKIGSYGEYYDRYADPTVITVAEHGNARHA